MIMLLHEMYQCVSSHAPKEHKNSSNSFSFTDYDIKRGVVVAQTHLHPAF